MTTLNETDIRNIIFGATIIGAGGGGSMSSGLDLLERFKASHPEKEVKVDMISVSSMDEDAYVAVTAGMGAPTAIIGKDFTDYAINAYDALEKMAARMGKPLKYTFPIEIGGFNTFVPMLISLLKGIPIVDADGAARAVPALDTLLVHVNGLDTSPLSMADNKNNRIMINLADPREATKAENIGRVMCDIFENTMGIAGWMLKKDQIYKALGIETISYAKRIGEVAKKSLEPFGSKESNKSYLNIYDHLGQYKDIDARGILTGTITRVETRTAGGFDYGIAEIKDDYGNVCTVLFQNENLVLYKNGEVIMTAPDIISLFDKGAQRPLTNADTAVGQWVDVGVLKVNEKWWLRDIDEINAIWAPYFNNVEYTGKIVKY